MAKYKVTVKYAVWKTEEYVIVTEKLAENSDDGPWNDKDQAQLEECPYDFCDKDTKTFEEEGDCISDSWDIQMEEIPVLDRIVASIGGAEVNTLQMSHFKPEDVMGLPYREVADDA